MKWYHYLAAFFAGLFLANTIPHFVNGVPGHPFPTPFADPPAQGLSSPITNVLWALFNLVIGYLLFRFSRVTPTNKLSLLIFFAGIVFISLWLSIAITGNPRL
jgi:small-conductance mechanosensitive channel